MSLVKSGNIVNCCAPNAIMTLKEYLEDYASPEVKAKGEKLIASELSKLSTPRVFEIATRNLELIKNGNRDFRF